MRPSRYLFALGAIFVVLYAVVLLGGSGNLASRLHPKLGLDLVGGTQLTLTAVTTNGQQVTAASLEQARQIIENRVNGMGVAEAEVVTQGGNQIIVSAPGNNNDTLRQVGVPAQLRFRKVLNAMNDSPDPVPGASASATPKPSGSATPSGTPTASASPTPAATPTPTATAAPTPTAASASPAASGTAFASPNASKTPTVAQQQQDIMNKLGPALQAAEQLAAEPPSDLSQPLPPATMASLEPFLKLTSDEIQLLNPTIQFYVPQITCAKLNARPPGSIELMGAQAVACAQGSDTKLLLDKSTVQGTDIASAQATINTNGGASAWVVNLTFNGDGAKKWQALTTEAYNNTAGNCTAAVTQPNQSSSSSPQVCEVAVVLDNLVVSAPSIQGVLTTQSTISGSFDQSSATLLANQLNYGALPITFRADDLENLSATLGSEYLQAGLLAAGIGMLLVVVYAFFYYRLLGLVITLSLVLSGMLTFGMLVFLGRQIGVTLTLAGIAGFIVSLGVAADSFVIYFERLKDEIREGRSPRSAVPRAWHRARRTIITANAVTVLAATVLYIVGIGSVKGFAFALGLATLVDLMVVFLFRHPIMTLLASRPAFLSPRVSGLGRVLQHATEDDAPTTRTPRRPKEA
jgi:preprotein translocase subunit SecD